MKEKTIFLTTGATFQFKDVNDVVEDEQTLEFNYVSRSDGYIKDAVFYKSFMAGHSSYDDE